MQESERCNIGSFSHRYVMSVITSMVESAVCSHAAVNGANSEFEQNEIKCLIRTIMIYLYSVISVY